MAADASQFKFTFVNVIYASNPHIYLTALPFAPPSSLVLKRYHVDMPLQAIQACGVWALFDRLDALTFLHLEHTC